MYIFNIYKLTYRLMNILLAFILTLKVIFAFSLHFSMCYEFLNTVCFNFHPQKHGKSVF